MKNILLAITFIFGTLSTCAQWQQLNFGNENDYRHVSFYGDSIGVLASKKVLFISKNYGNSWDTLFYNFNENIADVQFLEDSTIYVSGYPNSGTKFFKKTFDLGNSWAYNSSSQGGKMFFTSGSVGFVITSFRIYKTIDSAFNWDNGIYAGSGAIGNIFFLNDSIGYNASTYPGRIDKTIDGGITWQGQDASEPEDIFATSVDTAYYVSFYGELMRTVDGGINWVQQLSPTTKGLFSIFCSDNNTCYAVGDSGVIVHTSDGGLNWVKENSGTAQNLKSVYCTGKACYAVGDNGVVLKKTIGAVGGNMDTQNKNSIKLIPNPQKRGEPIFIENMIPKGENSILSIYNITGKIIQTISMDQEYSSIPTESLNPGVYLYQVSGDDKIIISGKLVIF